MVVESPSPKVFKMRLDWALDDLIQAPFAQERLDLEIFPGPFQPGQPWDPTAVIILKARLETG